MQELLAQLTSCIQQGQFLRAVPLAHQATALSDTAPTRELQVRLLEVAGIALRGAAQFSAAEAPLLQALSLQRAAGCQHADYARTLIELADLYLEIGRYSSAEKLYESALAIAEKEAEVTPTLLVDALLRFSSLLELFGRFDQVETFLQRAETLLLALPSPGVRQARLALKQVRQLWRLGSFRKAEALTNEAIRLHDIAPDSNPVERAEAELILIRFRLQQGRLEEAEQSCQNLLEVLGQRLGESHPRRAAILENLAYLRAAQGKVVQARQQARLALELNRSLFGQQHLRVADSLSVLAYVQQIQQESDEAQSLLRQARELYESLLGKACLQAITCTRELAESLLLDNQAEEAREYLMQILPQFSRFGKVGIAENLQSQLLLIRSLLQMNRSEEALQVAQKAVETARQWHQQHETPLLLAGCLDALARVYQSQGQFTEAESLCREALELRNEVLGPHPLTVESLRLFGLCRAAQGQIEEALTWHHVALEMIRSQLGQTHPEYLQVLLATAQLQAQRGNYEQAEQLYLQASQLEQDRVGENHPDYAHVLRQLARLYQAMNNFQAAEVRFRSALEILQKALGEEHPQVADAMFDLAQLYYQMGDLNNAEMFFQQTRTIRQQDPGEHHPDYAQTLHGLALVYQGMGRFEEAGPLFDQALSILDTSEGNAFHTLRLRHSMALFEQAQGHYRQAREQLLLVRDGLQKLVGANSPQLVGPLTDLAQLYEVLGDHLAAEALWRDILQLHDQALPAEHLQHAQDRLRLALCLRSQGEYAEARALVRRAILLLENVHGVNHPECAAAVGLLASLCQATMEEPFLGRTPAGTPSGRPFADQEPDVENFAQEAERLYRDALERTYISLGQNHPAAAVLLTELAGFYSSQGRFEEALATLRQACELNLRTFGEDHLSYVEILRLLAGLLQSLGQLDEAETLYRKRVTILQRLFGSNSPALAPARQMLAELYRGQNRLSEAENLCVQVVESFRRARSSSTEVLDDGSSATPGPSSEEWVNAPSLAMAESHLATVYMAQGKWSQAETLLLRVLRETQERFGEDHPACATIVSQLAQTQLAQQNWDAALDQLHRLTQRDSRLLPSLLSISGERNRAIVCHPAHENYESLLTSACEALQGNPVASKALLKRLFDIVLKRKRFGIDVLAAPLLLRLEVLYPNLSDELRRLRVLDRQIAARRLSGPGAEGKQLWQELLSDWERQREALESQLAVQIPELARRRLLREVDTAQVLDRLPAGAALVEFVYFRTRRSDPWSKTSVSYLEFGFYAAFVLHKERADVQMVPLGSAQQIDPLIRSYREALQNGQEEACESSRRALYAAVWAPLENLVADCGELVIAPDGGLWQVPLSCLIAQPEKWLRLVVCGRDVLGNTPPATQPALIVSNQQSRRSAGLFDWLGQLWQRWTASDANKPSSNTAASATTQVLAEVDVEIERVRRLLGEPAGAQETLTIDVIEKRERPRVVHLAAPAFFLLDQPWLPAEQKQPAAWQNPLVYSGLYLADEQTLTSRDVTRLDLRGSLVVLSGCETPYQIPGCWSKLSGLLSAFLHAGARAIVFSLWQPSAKARLALLEAFYRHFQQGHSVSESLYKAQSIVSARFPSRREWVGWICIDEIQGGGS
jgi:tetratricopeptide (TPR) repeat protein